MDRNELQQRLMGIFLDELEEHVQTLNVEIVELEKTDDAAVKKDLTANLFRAAHSLKGASRTVAVAPIEDACHIFENVLEGLRNQKLEVSQSLVSLVLAMADAVDSAGGILRQGGTVPADHFAHLMEPLKQSAAGNVPSEIPGQSKPEKETAPAAEPIPKPQAPPEPKPQPPEPAPTAAPKKATAASVRVAERKLDELISQAGELLVARQRIELQPQAMDELQQITATWKEEWKALQRSLRGFLKETTGETGTQASDFADRLAGVVNRMGDQLATLEKRLDVFQRNVVHDSRQLNHVGKVLQDDIHRLRMVPFSEACRGLQRAVRDVATSTGKEVELNIQGGDLEVDRSVLDGLRDPLLHLVRNAVDHGIEPPEARRENAKPLPATISVTASLRGSHVDVVVSDDGRGLDLNAIREKLRANRLPEPHDEQELARSIFLPGFSTAKTVTDVSGRGVGMDVVKNQLEMLRGTIDISTQAGFGTQFRMSLPLTLTTISALFVKVGTHVYAVPSNNVKKLIRFRPDELKSVGGREVLPLGDAPVPVLALSAALGIESSANNEEKAESRTALLLTTGERDIIFTVDEVLNEREAIVKNLGSRIRRVRHVSGATILRSGGIGLLLNATTLVRSGHNEHQTLRAKPSTKVESASTQHRLLVVDDSVTTRTLLKGILDAAGYEVTACVDGQDAWTELQAQEFDAVVSDVDMPRMDGFRLTKEIRKSERHQSLPVILLTSRDSDEDKARGVESGADAYLLKSVFDQTDVLETIQRFL